MHKFQGGLMRFALVLAVNLLLMGVLLSSCETSHHPHMDIVPTNGRHAAVALDAANYRQFRNSRGTIILAVNWGRRWPCAKFDNGQLYEIDFGLDEGNGKPTDVDIKLETPSHLFVTDEFSIYGLMVDPGKYDIAGVRFKVAKSGHVWKAGLTAVQLRSKFPEDQGGSFTVAAGEAIYIGHFALDCNGKDPVPWRYYSNSRAYYDQFLSAVRARHAYLKSTEVEPRLFKTHVFGNDVDRAF